MQSRTPDEFESDFEAFTEWSGENDCRSFDKNGRTGHLPGSFPSIGQRMRHYHKPYLERANEDNPNNARVPEYPGKGYIECLEYGWIEELDQANANYKYYKITEAGEAALRQPRQKPKPAARKIFRLQSRLTEMPSRLGNLPTKR